MVRPARVTSLEGALAARKCFEVRLLCLSHFVRVSPSVRESSNKKSWCLRRFAQHACPLIVRVSSLFTILLLTIHRLSSFKNFKKSPIPPNPSQFFLEYWISEILRCRSILPQSVFQPVLASFVALRAVAALWFANLQRRCSRNNFFYSAPGDTGRSRLSIALEETRPQGQSYAARRSRTSTQQQINHAASSADDSSEIGNACVHMNNHEMWQAGQHPSKSISGNEI